MGLNYSFAVVWFSSTGPHIPLISFSFKSDLLLINTSIWPRGSSCSCNSHPAKLLHLLLQSIPPGAAHSILLAPPVLTLIRLDPLLYQSRTKSLLQPLLRIINLLHIIFKFFIIIYILIILIPILIKFSKIQIIIFIVRIFNDFRMWWMERCRAGLSCFD